MTLPLASSIAAILARDLDAFRRSLAAYPDDASVWRPAGGLPNSAGTLALHVVGNLRHFVGAVLGGSGYVRRREEEFTAAGLPRAELDALLARTTEEVRAALARLDPTVLGRDFPSPPGGLRVATGDFLVHLCTHLAFHLGQADAHRRAVTGDPAGIGAVAVRELASARPEGGRD
jgi:uncharacterized damage-inducible protein DinB